MPAESASGAAPPTLTRQERASLRRELLRLAWPVVLQNVSRTLMFLVDTFMIGRVGAEAVAALGIVGPVQHTVVSVLMALSVGALATVARAWGEGDRGKQVQNAATAMALAAAAGVPLSVLGFLLLPEAAHFFALADAPEVADRSAGYLRYVGAVLLFFCMDFAAAGVLRGAGNTAVAMMTAVLGNTINVFLNWVFIFGRLGAPAMGVEGAGLATAIAWTVQGCLTAGFLLLPVSPVRLRVSSLARVTREATGRLVRVTLPALLEPVVMQCGFIAYAKFISYLGVAAMAAHRSAIAVESLTFMPGYGLAIAGSALVGRYLGARRPDLSQAAVHECARMAAYLMSAIGVVFLLVPHLLVGVFLPGERAVPVVALAALCLAISALEQPFLALSMAFQCALRGAGDTRSPLAVAIVGVWGVRIPLAWLMAFPLGMGLAGIWLTMIADWAVRSAIFAVLFRRGRWKSVKL